MSERADIGSLSGSAPPEPAITPGAVDDPFPLALVHGLVWNMARPYGTPSRGVPGADTMDVTREDLLRLSTSGSAYVPGSIESRDLARKLLGGSIVGRLMDSPLAQRYATSLPSGGGTAVPDLSQYRIAGGILFKKGEVGKSGWAHNRKIFWGYNPSESWAINREKLKRIRIAEQAISDFPWPSPSYKFMTLWSYWPEYYIYPPNLTKMHRDFRTFVLDGPVKSWNDVRAFLTMQVLENYDGIMTKLADLAEESAEKKKKRAIVRSVGLAIVGIVGAIVGGAAAVGTSLISSIRTVLDAQKKIELAKNLETASQTMASSEALFAAEIDRVIAAIDTEVAAMELEQKKVEEAKVAAAKAAAQKAAATAAAVAAKTAMPMTQSQLVSSMFPGTQQKAADGGLPTPLIVGLVAGGGLLLVGGIVWILRKS